MNVILDAADLEGYSIKAFHDSTHVGMQSWLPFREYPTVTVFG
jgi:hypothetical protein